MALPDLTHVGERLYAAIRPWAEPYDEQRGYPAAQYVHALASMLDPVAELVRDRDDMPGWAVLFDPDLCPVLMLPFLGRLVGVDLTTSGLTEQEMRTAIRERSGFKRGTPWSIRSVARKALARMVSAWVGYEVDPDSFTVQLLEKNGGPGHFTIVLREQELLGTPAVFVEAGVMDAVWDEQKPAGLTFDVNVSDAVTIDEGTATIDSVPATIDAATLADVT